MCFQKTSCKQGQTATVFRAFASYDTSSSLKVYQRYSRLCYLFWGISIIKRKSMLVFWAVTYLLVSHTRWIRSWLSGKPLIYRQTQKHEQESESNPQYPLHAHLSQGHQGPLHLQSNSIYNSCSVRKHYKRSIFKYTTSRFYKWVIFKYLLNIFSIL